MSGSLLAFFHLCLVFVLFSAQSILKWNEVLEKLFSLVSTFFRVFLNTVQIDDKKCVLRYSAKRILLYYSVIVTNVLALETNALKAPVKTSTPHRYTCSYMYQLFSSRACHETATHRHSPSKTGGSHAPVLTCEYATPTSYIRNSVLCWTTCKRQLQVD